jgi:phosphate transport system protein
MTRHFQREIDKLKKKMLHVAAMVEENLQGAVKSVTERDAILASEVIERDNDIDQMEVEVEEDCLKILALHQPVAYDLRFLIAVLKINNDLERIGDLATNIAERTKELVQYPALRVPFDLDGMLQLAIEMVKGSVDSLVELDSRRADQVCKTDDEMDAWHRGAYAAIQEEIAKNPDAVRYYISLLGISRNLERIGDHATNIAEDVMYMESGEIVRHQGEGLTHY